MEKLNQSQIFSMVRDFSKDFGIDPGYINLLTEAKSDPKMFELLFRFALRGLDASSAKKCLKQADGNRTLANDLLVEALFDQFTPKDGLQLRIADTEQRVNRTISDTKELTGRYSALVDGLQDTLTAQNQMIENLTKELNSLKGAGVHVDSSFDSKPEKASGRFSWRKKKKVEKLDRQKQREEESHKFIEEYAKNPAYTKEQILFLTQCLSEGISVDSFAYFCYPGCDMDFMKRMKNFYVNGSN